KFGQLIWREPRGTAAGYRWPQISIHRGALQMLLFDAVCQRLGRDRGRTRSAPASFAGGDGQVGGRVARPNGPPAGSDAASILVGADGIHSMVRRRLIPREGAPRFAQQILWRAAVDAEPFLGGHTMIIAGHFHRRVIIYPMGPASEGRLKTNWVVQM